MLVACMHEVSNARARMQEETGGLGFGGELTHSPVCSASGTSALLGRPAWPITLRVTSAA